MLFRRSRFKYIAAWAQERGFELERSGLWRRSYSLSWRDTGYVKRTAAIEDIAAVEAFVTARIDAGEAGRPGEWYLHWYVEELPPGGDGFYQPSPCLWCRWSHWVRVGACEGGPAKAFAGQYSNICTDPTPYPSPEAAIAASGLLSLETGARLSLSAGVYSLSRRNFLLPTPAYSDAAAVELVIDCVRGNIQREPMGVGRIAREVQEASGLASEQGKRIAERLVEEGRLYIIWHKDKELGRYTVLIAAPDSA